MLQPVKVFTDSVQKQIVKVIKSSIITGELKPGDKLLGERELASMLGVSRSSLREATKQLETAGFVTIKHGVGAFIKDADPDLMIKNLAFHFHFDFDENKLKELLAIRNILETQSAEWAAIKGNPEIIKKMKELVYSTQEKLKVETVGKLVLLSKQDTIFHILIAEASGNSIMVKIMYDLLDLLVESRTKAFTVTGRPQKSLGEHIAIVEAVSRRDAVGARKAMQAHLNSVEEEILGWSETRSQ